MTRSVSIQWQRSVVDHIRVAGQDYFIKRDDLLTPLSGNKARKLHGLLQQDLQQYTGLISHGGAQSNAMLALAQLAQLLGIRFDYYTRPVAKWLAEQPNGNLKQALDCGMQWHITDDGLPPSQTRAGALSIPQGIAMPEAELGLKLLAREIEAFCQTQQLEKLAIVTPSGTGTTALYLQQHLSHRVYTVPCIGNADSLQGMFSSAMPQTRRYPVILDTDKRYHFGEPHPELLGMYQQLLSETGIEFELMYDAKAWLVLLSQQFDAPVLYLHNGGTSGNDSMLARYRRLASLKDQRLPGEPESGDSL